MKYLIVITHSIYILGQKERVYANVLSSHCDEEAIRKAIQGVKDRTNSIDEPMVLNIIKLGD